MPYPVNAAVALVETPPATEAVTWIKPESLRNRALLDLSQAVPSYPPADALQEEVARVAREPETSLYTDILGIAPLRAAHATHMAQDYQGKVAPENVAITAGCNQAFCASLMALAQAGDNIILPVPYYFNHNMWLGMLGIEPRFVPGLTDEGPWPNVATVAAAIDARTRAIMLCSPNNPTGSVYPPEVIGAFYDLARARGIALIIDETYKDFRKAPAPLHDLLSRPGWEDTFIQLYSFSKAFAITGYRVGSIVAGPRFLAEVEKVLDCVAISAPHISQRAALFGLQHLEGWKREKAAVILARTEAITTAFKHPGLAYRLIGAGAFFAYVKHPFSGQTAKDVAKRLAGEHDLLCLPGSMFGPDQEDYLRIAFANAEADVMPAVVERLVESQR
ncbi:MAG: aminotransferase [Rhizobiales bacterium]|nr:aminotransferase [Hyphomicrobiales bacterium]